MNFALCDSLCPPNFIYNTKSIWNNKIKLFKVFAKRNESPFLPSFLSVSLPFSMSVSMPKNGSQQSRFCHWAKRVKHQNWIFSVCVYTMYPILRSSRFAFSLSRGLYSLFFLLSQRTHTHTSIAIREESKRTKSSLCAEFFACIHISLNIHAPAKTFVNFENVNRWR